MMDICGDNRFEIIAKAKADLLDATNIDTSEDEMKVLDNFLYRCWQMGWLDRYDRKTESTISKMEQVDEPMKTTDYCDICKRDMCEICVADATNPYCVPSHYEINYQPKDEPRTEEWYTFQDEQEYNARHGKERVMTNLEWIRTLSEEEFADWLYDEWLHHLQYRWSSSRGGLIIWLKDRKTENCSGIPNRSKDEPQTGKE